MKSYAALEGHNQLDNTLRDLYNSSYHNWPHPIIANYCYNNKNKNLHPLWHPLTLPIPEFPEFHSQLQRILIYR